MPLLLSCWILLLIGGGLRTSSKKFLQPPGIVILIACIPVFLLAFLVVYGSHGLLVVTQVLPFLALPYLMIWVALILPVAARSPKWLRVFAVTYGVVLFAWCVALVIASAPWDHQIIGK